ncbi:Odorant receptor 7a [Culex quinquefasciatus]|uniref:Odorant receptor n=1 Tax=Culex quinquefasciatus TaxID=7176 RepID=B0XCB3_CULQU|nr:Odorant receptor 7a [Culex quinquefasciatus]|eukprot:XP_001867285.1 Odorant receptor 7a [Culex quinquefasciatus]
MFNRIRQYLSNSWSSHVRMKPKTDFFYILNFYLSIAGVYFPVKNRMFRLTWKVFCVLVILHYVTMQRRLLQILQTEQSFELLVNGIHVAGGATIILVRSLLIHVNFRHFNQARKYLNERSFREEDVDVARIRQQSYELSVKVTIIFSINVLSQFVILIGSGITEMDPFLLPFSVKQFSLFEQKLYSNVYSGLFTVYSFIGASNFLTMYLGLVGLRAELRIAVDSFGKVMDRVNNRLENDPGEQNFWKFLQDELNSCIEHHSTVLNQLKVFKNLTSMSLLVSYYMTMAHTAIGVIHVLSKPSLDFLSVLAIDFTLRYLLEFYVFCHMVTSLNEEHSKIGLLLSHQPWISQLRIESKYRSQYRQIRATILNVMIQSQRSLNISCGGIFELSMDKFTTLIKTSYTLMAVVWNMQQGNGLSW